jgi:hypothetical protein
LARSVWVVSDNGTFSCAASISVDGLQQQIWYPTHGQKLSEPSLCDSRNGENISYGKEAMTNLGILPTGHVNFRTWIM